MPFLMNIFLRKLEYMWYFYQKVKGEAMKNKKTLLVLETGAALFSLFFGGGNLIFPPFLGYMSGSSYIKGLAGFTMTSILLPILGIACMVRYKDFKELSGYVSKRFSILFPAVLFLAMGPALGIPRNAAVSYEMAITPFVGKDVLWARMVYAGIFFYLAYRVAKKPEVIGDLFGKIMGPLLVVLIFSLFIGCIIKVPYASPVPLQEYSGHTFLKGFLEGYMTMDVIASLNFGAIILFGLKEQGMHDEKELMKTTIYSGIFAGFLLFVVYGCLAHLGVLGRSMQGEFINGAMILSNLSNQYFGRIGMIVMGLVFILACFTTVSGLLVVCGDFFAETTNKSPSFYAGLFAFVSFVIAVVGLDGILKYSIPLLLVLYPLCMVLLVLGFFKKAMIAYPYMIKTTILVTFIVSLIATLSMYGITIPFTTFLVSYCDVEFAWILPAILGCFLGIVISKHKMPKKA